MIAKLSAAATSAALALGLTATPAAADHYHRCDIPGASTPADPWACIAAHDAGDGAIGVTFQDLRTDGHCVRLYLKSAAYGEWVRTGTTECAERPTVGTHALAGGISGVGIGVDGHPEEAFILIERGRRS